MLLSFAEAKARWDAIDKNNYRTSDAKKFFFFKSFWDSYSGRIDNERTLISLIAKELEDDFQCRNYRPLGDFRVFDVMSDPLTSERVYENWITRIQEEITGKRSIFEVVLLESMKNDELLNGGKRTMSMKEMAEAFSIMLYRSTSGVVYEARVLHELQAIFEKMTDYTVAPAPAALEGEDVDGIIYRSDDGSFVAKFSVKNFGALSPQTIKVKRGKGKTRPLFYIGYKNDTDKKMTCLNPSGNKIHFDELLQMLRECE